MFFKRGANSGELYLNIANPYRLIAVSRYVQTKGVEGLSEKDAEEMRLFFQIIQENDAWQKILNGCICYALKEDSCYKALIPFGKMRALFLFIILLVEFHYGFYSFSENVE